ncbi:MAG TPA: toxin-antitoxin system HicB family antitoxin [Candidatus Ruania gallistercoris]|uniref:Toxin-antitoxin system HicB family antitoxin n=1 Tax=Candidatus Ruania gallistercoris TaxID=2838746 RepID=A0A9D2EFS2_9MICO|nr:toxin-antitoxin system HicB family antitoxin [Candidatus Ruania gallistercoris]
MDLNPYLSSLRQALATAAGTSSADVQEAADRLAQSLEPALRLTLMELASDVAADVTSRLDGAVVEVRLRGGLAELVVDQQVPTEQFAPPTPPEPPTPPLPPEPEDASHTRVTLRLPESVKARVDEAAASDGVSINSWLVRAVQKALTTPGSASAGANPTRSGRRMTGWVR